MDAVPTGEVIEKAVLLSGRAPSLHNSQPWRWDFDGSALRLFSVPGRILPATDPSGRQMLISCGAALDHLRVALAAVGWRVEIARFPDPNNRDHLATVVGHRAEIVTDADLDRAAAISRRYTDRLPCEPPGNWDTFESILRTTFDPVDVVLDVLPDDCRPRLAHASELTASLRRYDAGYQAELRWWTGQAIAAMGVPREALITREEREVVDIGRTFPTTTGPPRRAELAADESQILVLSTDSDAPGNLLRCGEVLSTVLLECTAAGYATCPLTHLTELARSRAIVGELTGRAHLPQVLVRVGAAPEQDEGSVTPRRPLTEIFTITDRR